MIHVLLALLLLWDPVTTDIHGDPEVVEDYILYFGTQSGMYDSEIPLHGTTQFFIADEFFRVDTFYYFTVRAMDLACNKSVDYSNEVQYDPLHLSQKFPQRFIYLQCAEKKKNKMGPY